ncbi:MAG: hypothetical protein MRK02_08330 [Candidatus Scalindua sp.]|nr:hypothetical protein [Candidatus Scalindua sp.]
MVSIESLKLFVRSVRVVKQKQGSRIAGEVTISGIDILMLVLMKMGNQAVE